jgi:hypothetical protein
MRRKTGLVLASEHMGDFGGHTTEGLTIGVDDIPLGSLYWNG